jgi:hypothetical protein
MRTVQVGSDHVANYMRVAKGHYRYALIHAATRRDVADGDCRVLAGGDTETQIAAHAASRLALVDKTRVRKSTDFAAGKSVSGAPSRQDMPPPIREQLAEGKLEISAAVPQQMILDAYRTGGRVSALLIGRQVLIGAADSMILAVARGEAVLQGSLTTGVTYHTVQGSQDAAVPA